MEQRINPLAFVVAAILMLSVVLSASVLLPHDRYHRFQAHNDVTTRKADWIYERLHFDPTPIDVALIGTSRTAGGLSGPLIERAYCKIAGRRIHVANLSIPTTGRNMHYVIAKEAARAKNPAFMVVELNEIESRRPHAGFIFLADAQDVLSAPVAFNLNYFSDILRLPGRQVELFAQGLTGKAAIRAQFNPKAYAGPNFDLTEVVIAIDGRIQSRRVTRAKPEMDAMRAARMKDVSPFYLFPKPFRGLEYRFSRRYLQKIKTLVADAGGETAFVYVPAYGAAAAPARLLEELRIADPVINLGGEIAADASMWLDATHFNADGAATASKRFAESLAARRPMLGADGCD